MDPNRMLFLASSFSLCFFLLKPYNKNLEPQGQPFINGCLVKFGIFQFFNIHVYMVGLGVPGTSTTPANPKTDHSKMTFWSPTNQPTNQPLWACNTLGPMDPDCLTDHPANIPGKKTKIALMVGIRWALLVVNGVISYNLSI